MRDVLTSAVPEQCFGKVKSSRDAKAAEGLIQKRPWSAVPRTALVICSVSDESR